jgi:hypothetical protein
MNLSVHLLWNHPISSDHILTLLISTKKIEAARVYKRLTSTDNTKQSHSLEEQNMELHCV